MLSSMKENEYKIVADTVDNDDYVFCLEFVYFLTL